MPIGLLRFGSRDRWFGAVKRDSPIERVGWGIIVPAFEAVRIIGPVVHDVFAGFQRDRSVEPSVLLGASGVLGHSIGHLP